VDAAAGPGGADPDDGADRARAGAADLRRALVAYVHAVHEAYLVAGADPDGDVTDLPLAVAPFTVAIVAGGQLHLVATRTDLPELRPHEEPVDDAVGPLRWQVRFLDVTVLPELASVAGTPDPTAAMLDLLGGPDRLYHLQVTLDGSLSPHHAMHAGTGLGHAHRAAPT
jgi:hypothetical protein